MLHINDNVFISLKFDGKELDTINLSGLTLTEGNGALVPAIKIEISDPTSQLAADKAISEGNKIELIVARSQKDNKARPRKYRIFGPVRSNNPMHAILTIIGILDAPKYVSASAREGCDCTSDGAMKKLAEASGLKYSGTTECKGRVPNDKQKWLNVCKSRAAFVNEIARFGWMDKYSGMGACVTSHGQLRYRNLVDVINTPHGEIKYLFTHNTIDSSNDSSKTVYLVKQAKDRSSGGAMASWQNYGSTRVVNKMSGAAAKIEKLEVKTPGSYLSINQEVSEMVKKVRFDYAPIDCGNTHKKYDDAYYQNLKILALFSEKMSVLVDVVTEVALFDPVIYRQADADPTKPIAMTDIYIVVGKSIVVRGGIHYAERLELARMSLTMKGSTELKKPSGGASEASMTPSVAIDKNSSGTIGRANASAISGISNKVTGMSDVTNALRDARTSVGTVLTNVQNSISNYVNALLKDTGVKEAIVEVAGAARTTLNTINAAQALYRNSAYAAQSLTNQVKSMPVALRQAALSAPASFVSALTHQANAMIPYSRSVAALRSVANSIPKKHSGTDSAALISTLNSCDQLLSTSSGLVSGQWNLGVSSLRNLPIPGDILVTDTVSRLDNMLQTVSTTYTATEKFIGAELVRDSSRSSNWMPSNALSPAPTITSIATNLGIVTNLNNQFNANKAS